MNSFKKTNANGFDRPVIILSAPRSGSTLLFEVLARSESLWTIGRESHSIIEAIPELNQAVRGFDSNSLTADDLTGDIADRLLAGFRAELRNTNGTPIDPRCDTFRFLEKTPKNSLRIGFLDRLFPDALYIYLVRDPRENISSIMEAWRSGRFMTYPRLPGWHGGWSLLLPPGWREMIGQPLQRVAAWQWQQANEAILDSLLQLPDARWYATSYRQLVDNPGELVAALCRFCDVPLDNALQRACESNLPYSRFTISAPSADKWLENYDEIRSVWPEIEPTVEKMNLALARFGIEPLPSTWTARPANDRPQLAENERFAGTPRNAPCPCGSGQRFKQCHGVLH